jgi:hypothetical protein
MLKKKVKRKKRAELRRSSEALHVEVCDALASMLATAREKGSWDQTRTRVVVVVSTDHGTKGVLAKLSILTSALGHTRCVVAEALMTLETPYAPPPLIVTRH